MWSVLPFDQFDYITVSSEEKTNLPTIKERSLYWFGDNNRTILSSLFLCLFNVWNLITEVIERLAFFQEVLDRGVFCERGYELNLDRISI